MKKIRRLLLYSIVSLFLVGGICFAQVLQIYRGPTHTVLWDDDNLVMPEETLSWVIWVTDRADYTAELAEVTEQEYLIDITSYDFQVIVGVQAKIVSGEEVYLSEITWSDSGDVELVPLPFALLQGVQRVRNLRRGI